MKIFYWIGINVLLCLAFNTQAIEIRSNETLKTVKLSLWHQGIKDQTPSQNSSAGQKIDSKEGSIRIPEELSLVLPGH